MGCAISPSGFPQIFSVKNRFFSMRHRLSGVHEPHKRFAPNGRQPFSLHRLSGVRELRKRVCPDGAAPFSAPAKRSTRTALACSPLTGGSFSAPADRGARTALACSPFPGGEFSAEPQRGIRRLRTAGASRRPPRGQKGRDTCGFPSSLNSYLSLAS